MKTIAEITGGAQALLNISFNLQDCFKARLNNGYRTFLQLLRVIESVTPMLSRPGDRTDRKPYKYLPFFRSQIAKSFFGIEKTSHLIQRLNGKQNPRLLCGFDKVPYKATFSTMFAALAKSRFAGTVFDMIVKDNTQIRISCQS